MRIKQRFGIAGGFLTLLLLPLSGPVSAQGLMVTGYADLEAIISNPDGSGNSDFYFDNHHFNVIMVGHIARNLFAAVEVEYEHGGEEIKMEYGYFAYTGITNTRIIAGKFIVPFGRFNKDLHPTIINKVSADRPHGFKDILPQTYGDVGLWVSGSSPTSASGARFVYDAFVVNGLMGDDGGGIRGFRGNDREKRTGDRDDNKAVGARAGAELGPQGLDFGASVYHGNYANDAALGTLNLTLIGADAAFRSSGFEARGEVIRASQDATGGDLTKTGGYIQMAYLVTSKLEPVVRFSARNMPGESSDQQRLSIGTSFYVAPSSSVRVAYHFNLEKSAFAADNNTLAFQWNIIL